MKNAAAFLTERPLRVLYVHDHLGYPGGVVHGVTTYFLSVLPRFDPLQIEHLLCINGPRHPAAEALKAAGIRPVFLNRGKWDPRVLIDLIRLIRDERIDVLHLTGMKGMLMGRIAGRVTGCPSIIHFHDTNPAWPRFVQRWLSRWTHWALANSEAARQLAIADYAVPPEKSEVLQYGISPEQFAGLDENVRRRIRVELELPERVPAIAVIGRLVPEKGQDVLLHAMPKILAQVSDARLLIVGDGCMRAKWERLGSDLGVSTAVRFTGHRADIPAMLCAIDVVAVPSLWEEAFGYVALEALCAGRAVVASRVGGIPEFIIDGETGLLVPKGDVDGLARAVVRLLEDRLLRERLARAGREHTKRFSIQRHVQSLTEIYRIAAGTGQTLQGNGSKVQFSASKVQGPNRIAS